MTRKDYVLIANSLSEVRPDPTDVEKFDVWVTTVENFVQSLKYTNPQFNPERFRTACGI